MWQYGLPLNAGTLGSPTPAQHLQQMPFHGIPVNRFAQPKDDHSDLSRISNLYCQRKPGESSAWLSRYSPLPPMPVRLGE